MTFYDYAKSEFELYFKTQKPPKNDEEIKLRKNLEETIESIGMIVDQSIFDANVIRTFIDRMLRFRTFSPLTGADEEWELYKESDGESVQAYINKRCPSVIKYIDATSKEIAVDLNGIIFKDSLGNYYKDPNRARVIEFPYNPPITPEAVLDEEETKEKEETNNNE
jgi:hypothetical protein